MVVRYSLYFIVMALYTAPLLGVKVMPPAFLLNWKNGAVFLLVIHEFSGFLFFGHTLFSNIWAMRVRMTADHATGVMARAMLRKMALGGFASAPWALAAYVAFWIMAAIQLVPDIIRYAVDTHAADPKRDVKTAAIRGIGSTMLTFYIIWCMVTKNALFI